MVKKYAKAIHALAPDSNAAKTPVLKTTGDVEGGAATGHQDDTTVGHYSVEEV